MGKKNNKDNDSGRELLSERMSHSWLGGLVGDKETRDMHKTLRKRYGVEKPEMGRKLDNTEKNREIRAAQNSYGSKMSYGMNNDYDIRRGMEEMALAGDKDAKKFAKKGIRNLTDVTNAYNMFKDEYVDGGGEEDKFGSRKSFASVAYDKVKSGRDELASKEFLNSKINELKAEGAQDVPEAETNSAIPEAGPSAPQAPEAPGSMYDVGAEATGFDADKYSFDAGEPLYKKAKEKAQTVLSNTGSYGDSAGAGDMYGNVSADKMNEYKSVYGSR